LSGATTYCSSGDRQPELKDRGEKKRREKLREENMTTITRD